MIDYKERSRDLRKNSVYSEKVMWTLLRNRQLSRYKFRRQYVIQPYIIDFVCLHKKLVIELDGEYHELQKGYDDKRTRFLESKGYRVIRFTNEQLHSQYLVVLQKILDVLKNPSFPSPYPLPHSLLS
jgi:very-short-patch-repair endonuclease